jgi:hypothetical protein
VPSPDLQPRVHRRDGTVIGRADFGWETFRTLGEFDGRVKYGRLLRTGQEPGDAVFREKRREDELRDHRWEVARWRGTTSTTPASSAIGFAERSPAAAGDDALALLYLLSR